jgi:hypothetical protein
VGRDRLHGFDVGRGRSVRANVTPQPSVAATAASRDCGTAPKSSQP